MDDEDIWHEWVAQVAEGGREVPPIGWRARWASRTDMSAAFGERRKGADAGSLCCVGSWNGGSGKVIESGDTDHCPAEVILALK